MHTTWRATLALWLLAAGGLLALLLAASMSAGETSRATIVLAWLLVLVLGSAVTAASLHQRQAERFRRQLAVGLTHHLRTSLAHIQAFNEMLLLGRESSEEERQKWLEVIGREAEHLGNAVENVLLIVNHHRAGAYPVRRSVDLGQLLEDVACAYPVDCAPGAVAKGPLPGIIVEADPAALRHALSNLFASLGRDCGPGSRLSVTLTSDGATATIVVGMENGVDESLATNGDGPLRENDLEGETGAGFGLEIAVVQHVARAHGGRAFPFHDTGHTGYRLELPLSRI